MRFAPRRQHNWYVLSAKLTFNITSVCIVRYRVLCDKSLLTEMYFFFHGNKRVSIMNCKTLCRAKTLKTVRPLISLVDARVSWRKALFIHRIVKYTSWVEIELDLSIDIYEIVYMIMHVAYNRSSHFHSLISYCISAAYPRKSCICTLYKKRVIHWEAHTLTQLPTATLTFSVH